MTLDINKAAQPYNFYMKFIKENVRPDNRNLSDVRAFKVDLDCINTANGSALVKLGSTLVLCGVKAQLCKPKDDEPNNGFIIPNVDLPPLCSVKFKNVSGNINEQAQYLTQLMFDIIKESKCINEEDLCIKSGTLVWCLYIDIICLNYDGNLQDTCCLAMISALKCTKLYEIVYDDDAERPTFKVPFNQIRLPVYNTPISTTVFSIDDAILLCDPNKEEEDFARSYVTICTLDNENICVMRKLYGFVLFDEQINLSIDRAIENGNILRQTLNKYFD
jgi:exosome complex component RRP43